MGLNKEFFLFFVLVSIVFIFQWGFLFNFPLKFPLFLFPIFSFLLTYKKPNTAFYKFLFVGFLVDLYYGYIFGLGIVLFLFLFYLLRYLHQQIREKGFFFFFVSLSLFVFFLTITYYLFLFLKGKSYWDWQEIKSFLFSGFHTFFLNIGLGIIFFLSFYVFKKKAI